MSELGIEEGFFEHLETQERLELLHLARSAMESGVKGFGIAKLDLNLVPPRLRKPGASFVTLTAGGALRGCIGGLEATQPLAEDVRIHAVAAALEDFRFPPVVPDELPNISIEISRLTPLRSVEYDNPSDLLTKLHPCIDGVVLKDGSRRATFLPQVWSKVPEPDIFLTMLCQKMGLPGDTWRIRKLSVFRYQIEEIHEDCGAAEVLRSDLDGVQI
jgi:AmmeMemoRadiSam system protein A